MYFEEREKVFSCLLNYWTPCSIGKTNFADLFT